MYIYEENGTNRKQQLQFVCSKLKTEKADFRLFSENGKRSQKKRGNLVHYFFQNRYFVTVNAEPFLGQGGWFLPNQQRWAPAIFP
jgi:hypothetical protein